MEVLQKKNLTLEKYRKKIKGVRKNSVGNKIRKKISQWKKNNRNTWKLERHLRDVVKKLRVSEWKTSFKKKKTENNSSMPETTKKKKLELDQKFQNARIIRRKNSAPKKCKTKELRTSKISYSEEEEENEIL